jgi:hypothetical protein
MAGTSGKTTQVGVAIQNYHSSNALYAASTAFNGLILTDRDSSPNVTIEDIDDEFGDGQGLFSGNPGERLGIHTPFSGNGRLRADHFGYILKAAGFACVTTTASPVAGANTHVFEPVATDALFPWSSWYDEVGSGANLLQRLLVDARLQKLALNAQRNATAKFSYNGLAAHEEEAAGTETVGADTANILRTVSGAFTLQGSGSVDLAGTPRSLTVDVSNQFPSPQDEMVLADHEMTWMEFLGMMASGDVDASFDADAFKRAFYGSSSGSEYSFLDVSGALTYRMESAGYITGTTKYSATVYVPTLVARGRQVRSQGRSMVNLPVAWKAYKSTGNPLIRFTLVNGITSYA